MLPPLISLLLLAADDLSPLPSTRTERLILFATLTEAEARQLHGKRVTVLVELDFPAWEDGGFLGFECVSDDANSRTLWLAATDDTADRMVVEGTLRVLRHPPSADGAFLASSSTAWSTRAGWPPVIGSTTLSWPRSSRARRKPGLLP